jgi:hypothetical protein
MIEGGLGVRGYDDRRGTAYGHADAMAGYSVQLRATRELAVRTGLRLHSRSCTDASWMRKASAGRSPLLLPVLLTEDGAFMEPRGCNQWRPAANGVSASGPKTGKTVAAGCHQLRSGAHGKEGVSGSSPEEGSAKAPHNGAFSVCVQSPRAPLRAGMEPFIAFRSRRRSMASG